MPAVVASVAYNMPKQNALPMVVSVELVVSQTIGKVFVDWVGSKPNPTILIDDLDPEVGLDQATK